MSASKPTWKRHPQVTVKCETCGADFQRYFCKKKRFCSRVCASKACAATYQSRRLVHVCLKCGVEYSVRPNRNKRTKFCSFACKQAYQGQANRFKQSGLLRGKGTGEDGAVLPTTYLKYLGRHLHRQIAEKKLGRPLEAGEVVHHIDGNRHNNAPENLAVMTQAEHARIHALKRWAGINTLYSACEGAIA